jgi:hypothetical protein
MELNPIQANMTEVILNDNRVILFSYKTPVACRISDRVYRTNKRWSNTTTRHINKWLAGTPAEPQDQEFFDNLGGKL